MKVKVIKSRQIMSIAGMWYCDRIGEEFEVEEDERFPDLYRTEADIDGNWMDAHIYRDDCEVLPQATESTATAQ